MKTRMVSLYLYAFLKTAKSANQYPIIAENYYTADYPDDEVDSEDEFDRAAYLYRTGNASDLEEYDERDGDDVVILAGDGEDSEAPVPLSARLGLQPPSAFGGRRF